MSDPTPTNIYASRWRALLAENAVIQNEHLELTASFTPPFSAQQMMQLDASAAQRHKLHLKLRDLVNEWAADSTQPLTDCDAAPANEHRTPDVLSPPGPKSG